MSPLFFSLLIGLAGSIDPLSPYRFQPISEIIVDAPDGFEQAEFESLIGLTPGQLVHIRTIQKAVKRIYQLGTIQDVQVFAERREGAVRLRFFIEPKRLFGGLEIVGLESLDADDMSGIVSPSRLSEVTGQTELEMLQSAKEHLYQAGFRSPKFELRALERSTYSGVYYRLFVQEGPRQVIESVELSGDAHYSQASLIRVIQSPQGAPLTQSFLQESKRNLVNFYLKRGFPDVQVQISEPSIGNLNFNIQSGTQWFVGMTGLKMTGAAHFQDLWAKFLQQGSNRDITNLRNQVEYRLVELGFPDGSVQVSTHQPRPSTKLVEIRVTEGTPIEIDTVSWLGTSAFSPERLQQELEAELVAALETKAPWKGLDEYQRQLVRGSGQPKLFTTPQGGLGSLSPVESRWVPPLYAKALRRIESLYRDRGFFEAQIEAPQLSGTGQFRQVAITLNEGKVTKYGRLEITGNEAFSPKALELYLATMFKIATDAPVRLSMLEEARIGLIRRYRDQGYLYARVEFELQAIERNQAILKITIDENTPVTLGRIYVRGHEHTSEKFIRNRITLEPGAPYFLNQALEDQRRLSELDIFSRVRLRLVNEEEPEPVKDLVAEVAERKRTKLQLSGGISTEDGPRLKLGWYRFNIFGEGVTSNASLRVNRQIFFDLYGPPGESLIERYDSYTSAFEQFAKALEREVRLGLKSPPIMGLPGQPVLRVDLLNERDNRIAYSLDALRLLSGIDFRPYSWLLAEIEPGFTITNLECADPDVDCGQDLDGNQNTRLRLDRGRRTGVNLGSQVTIDFRNSPFNPSKGWSLRLGTEYASGIVQDQGVLDNTTYAFLKSEGRLTGYLPLGSSVLALALWGGRIDVLDGDAAPIDQRFFLGGRRTLRGFFDDSIFPADACLEGEQRADCAETFVNDSSSANTIPLPGGHSYILGKGELRVGLTENLTLNSFVESGNLWYWLPTSESFDLRLGLGFGISYTTPVGPLAVSVGFNPFRKPQYYESLYEFHISIGQF